MKLVGRMLRTSVVDQQPKKGRKTIEGDQSELAKDPPIVKSIFLLITQV